MKAAALTWLMTDKANIKHKLDGSWICAKQRASDDAATYRKVSARTLDTLLPLGRVNRSRTRQSRPSMSTWLERMSSVLERILPCLSVAGQREIDELMWLQRSNVDELNERAMTEQEREAVSADEKIQRFKYTGM